MNTGWECPKCGTVYAPSVSTCGCCTASASKEREPVTGPNFPPRLDIADDCRVKCFEMYVGGYS